MIRYIREVSRPQVICRLAGVAFGTQDIPERQHAGAGPAPKKPGVVSRSRKLPSGIYRPRRLPVRRCKSSGGSPVWVAAWKVAEHARSRALDRNRRASGRIAHVRERPTGAGVAPGPPNSVSGGGAESRSAGVADMLPVKCRIEAGKRA